MKTKTAKKTKTARVSEIKNSLKINQLSSNQAESINIITAVIELSDDEVEVAKKILNETADAVIGTMEENYKQLDKMFPSNDGPQDIIYKIPMFKGNYQSILIIGTTKMNMLCNLVGSEQRKLMGLDKR